MGVELPVLGHLATTQNRMAPPSPDGTKSCAKLPFLPVPSPRSGMVLLFSTSKTLLQKAGPEAIAEMAREFVDRDRGSAGSNNLSHSYTLALEKPTMSTSLAHTGENLRLLIRNTVSAILQHPAPALKSTQ